MKEIKTKVQPQDLGNWLLPDNSLSHSEFISGIKKAENGPFYTVQESMEHFEKWLKEVENKFLEVPLNYTSARPIFFNLFHGYHWQT